MIEYLAKSNGYNLEEHLIDTANKCKEYAEKITNDKQLIAYSYLIGLFHDYGKCTSAFQKYLAGNSESVEHSITSALFVSKFINYDKNTLDSVLKSAIIRSVLFHHPVVKKDNDNVEPNSVLTNDEIEFGKHLVRIYNDNIGKEFGCEVSINDTFIQNYLNDEYDCINFNNYTPFYYDDDNLGKINSFVFFFILILRQADILSSNKNLNIDDFTIIKSYENIKINKPEGYDERFEEQLIKSEELSKKPTTVFKAQTGYGKTMLGLLYLLQNNKKGYWICPRNTIAQGVYQTLTKEIRALGLDISVALLLTGTYKECINDNIEEFENGIKVPDIIVTNIDNFFSPLIKTNSNYRNFTLLNSNCIFDEFHEYATREPIFAAYWSIMKCRVERCCNSSNTLLLSATPEKRLYEPFIRRDESCVFEGKNQKLLNKKYKIVFSNPPDDVLKGQDILVYRHSVKCVQEEIEKDTCDFGIHANYTETDKNKHLDNMLKKHGKGSEDFNNSWVGNSVIGVGLDISFNHAWLNNLIPNMFLQTIGRIDRWLDKSESPILYVTNNSSQPETGVITQVYTKSLSNEFYQYLKNKITDGEIVTSETLYALVEDFKNINDNGYKKLIKDFKTDSFKQLAQIDYSYSVQKTDDGVKHISNKPSLRSVNKNNIFVIVNNSEMSEPMQVDVDMLNTKSKKDGKDLRDIISDVVKIIKNNDKYFKNKYQRNGINKSDSKMYDYLINLSKCSETPFVLPSSEFGYTIKKGIYKK